MIRVRDYFLIIIFFLDPSICRMFFVSRLIKRSSSGSEPALRDRRRRRSICDVTPPVNFSVTQQEVEHHHQTIKLKFQLKCVNQEQKGRKRSEEEVSGFRRSHGSRRQLREVSAATSRLAGSSRSPLSGGFRMEVLIKTSHRSALSSSSSPSPASLRIHTAKRMLGRSRCHPAGVCRRLEGSD